MSCFAVFVVRGITNGAHGVVHTAESGSVGVDGVPHGVGVVGHFALAPGRSDDHDTLHGRQLGGVKAIHVNDVGFKSVIGSKFRCLFGEPRCVSGLRTEEDVDGAVAGKHGVESIGHASSGCDGSGRGGCFNSGGSGFDDVFCSPVAHQLVFDDLNRTGFCGFDDDVAEFCT